MRAVGLDPSACVVTTVAGPGGVIVPRVVQDGHSYRVKVRPSEVGAGSWGAPP